MLLGKAERTTQPWEEERETPPELQTELKTFLGFQRQIFKSSLCLIHSLYNYMNQSVNSYTSIFCIQNSYHTPRPDFSAESNFLLIWVYKKIFLKVCVN